MTDRPSAVRAAPRRFLPEVQALRALAVAMVVVYHVRPDLLPGGFVGVDVFFVISGFLITGHLLREVEGRGRVSLVAFWAARARRILPASLLLIAVVLLTATFVLPPSEWAQVRRHGLASVFYVENWVLALDSVDYLAAGAPTSPFQHFWSLAVEEQFYLVWPLFFVLAAFLVGRSARTRALGARVVLVVVLGAVVVASFVVSVTSVRAGDPAAYFATTTRVWELGAGGLLAFAVPLAGRMLVRSALALAGVGTIVASGCLLSATDPFPGLAALGPVLGATAVIVAGRTSGPLSLHGLVDSRAVQWLGAASYSVYLWHFPLAVYFLVWAGRGPTMLESVVIVLATVVLAGLSHRFVELPFRGRWRRRDPATLRAAAVAMVVVAALAGVVSIRIAVESDREIEVHVGSGYGAEAVQGTTLPTFVGADRLLAPSLATVGDDEVSAFDEDRCSARKDDPAAPKICTFGPTRADVSIALVGDSHARMFGSPVVALAAERGWRVDTYLRDSCPFSTQMRTLAEGPDCVAANAETLDALLEARPDAVLTVSYGASRFHDDGGPERPGVEGFVEMWRALEDAGIDVLALKDVPQPDELVVRCVTSAPENPRRCATDRDEALQGRDIVDDAAGLVPGVHLIDLTDRFCGPHRCPPVIGNVMVYRDTNHITDTYARSLTTVLGAALDDGLAS